MNLKRIIIISLMMLIFLGVTAVGATENMTLTDSPQETGESEIPLSDAENPTDTRPEPDVNFYIPSEVLTGSQSIYVESSNPGDFDGEVEIYIDNEYKTNRDIFPLTSGYEVVDIKNISEGMHACNLVYEGDGEYAPFNKTFHFEVKNIIISSYEKMYPTESINVLLASGATGTVTVNVNGSVKRYDVQDYFNGEYAEINYKLKKLKCGETYDVEITYSGNYGNVTKRENITITYYMGFYTSIYGNLNDYLAHCSDEFVFFDVGATGEIQVFLDGVNLNYDKTKDKPGSVARSPNEFDGCIFDRAPIWLNGISLAKGNHTLELRCLGDANYPAQSLTESFYLDKTILRVDEELLIDNENTLKFIFGENETGNVSLYLSEDGKNYNLIDSTEIVKNIAILKFTTSKQGKNYIKVVSTTISGKEKSKASFKAVAVKFKYTHGYEPWIGVTPYRIYSDTLTLECGKNVKGKLYIYIKDESGKKKLYKKVKIKKGIARAKVPNNAYSKKIGNYRIVAVWKTNYGKGSETSDVIYVEKAQTVIKASKVSAKYGKSTYFRVGVNDEFGKPVKNILIKLKIGKTTYSIKTNKKGVAKFNTKNLKAGTYKVKITSGNANYDISAKSTITIKR